MKTSLIIPFKNEEEYVRITMERVLHFLSAHELDFEIIAVDDSTDKTWEILQGFKTTHQNVAVIKGGHPSGYGKALQKGFSVATGDIFIPFNGDLSDSLEDVITFINLIEKGNDMVFGSRYMRQSKVTGSPVFKSFISRLGNIFLQLLYQVRCNDITNSFKAYRRSVIEQIELTSEGYTIVIEMALKSILSNYTYVTVPITWRGREYGISKMSFLKVIPTYLSMAFKVKKMFMKQSHK